MDFKMLILKAFTEVEAILQDEANLRKAEGDPSKPRLELNLVGQAALLLSPASLSLEDAGTPLRATREIDAFSIPTNWPRFHDIRKVLLKYGVPIDDMSSEIWMPEETFYSSFFPSAEFEDTLLKVSIADHEAIIISKARFKRDKDIAILDSYLASSLPTQRFWDMVDKHGIDLA